MNSSSSLYHCISTSFLPCICMQRVFPTDFIRNSLKFVMFLAKIYVFHYVQIQHFFTKSEHFKNFQRQPKSSAVFGNLRSFGRKCHKELFRGFIKRCHIMFFCIYFCYFGRICTPPLPCLFCFPEHHTPLERSYFIFGSRVCILL